MKATGRKIGLDVQIVDGHLQCTPIAPDGPCYSMDFVLPSMKMVEACRADDFDFFQPFIDAGKLTVEQMHRAAQRYYLGKTRSGRPIFWMIDDMLDPLDAHITPDSWISTLLKAREPFLQYWRVRHCLFGLHLLMSDVECRVNPQVPIAIVESERSAVLLSELFPENLWLAYVSIPHLDIDLFAPLQGRNVTIYPRTDPSFSTYLFFDDLAASIRKHYDIHTTVSSILEDNATDAQKERCIDLIDFILEDQSHTDNTYNSWSYICLDGKDLCEHST